MSKLRFLYIILVILLITGCGKSENNAGINTAEIEENIKGQNKPEYIDGFEVAEYDKFNSYASENGLKDTLIVIEGTLINSTVIDSDSKILEITVEQDDGNRWTVGVPALVRDKENIFDDIINEKIRVFGTYSGYSDLFNLPAIVAGVEDENNYDKARIEIYKDGKYSNFWCFEDYIKEALEYTDVMAEDNKEYEKGIDEDAEIENQQDKDDSAESDEKKEDDNLGNVTIGQKNALVSAKNYLDFTSFSYLGLIDQLEYEKYTHDEAVYAAENCGADWNEQAVLSAKNYLDYSAFSYKSMIEQLKFEKFTDEQATYGTDNCGADWMEQAVKSAENYLSFTSFSKAELIEQLEYEGFTHEQAVYGVEQNGY